MNATAEKNELLPWEHEDIREDVRELLSNADAWLETENVAFTGRKPKDLIGTPDERLLRNMLRAAISGNVGL